VRDVMNNVFECFMVQRIEMPLPVPPDGYSLC